MSRYDALPSNSRELGLFLMGTNVVSGLQVRTAASWVLLTIDAASANSEKSKDLDTVGFNLPFRRSRMASCRALAIYVYMISDREI